MYVDSGSANQKHSAIGAKAPAFAGNITGIFTATSGRITIILQEALYLGNYDLVSDSGEVTCALENVPSPPQGQICSLGDCGHSTLWVHTGAGDIQMRCVRGRAPMSVLNTRARVALSARDAHPPTPPSCSAPLSPA